MKMLIIKIDAKPSGEHDSQTWDGKTRPDGYAQLPPEYEAVCKASNYFVKLTVENGMVTAVEDDAEARAAWEERPAPEPTAEEQIAALKQQLAQTDYRIIKCSEYRLAGLELPYDVEALHAERQAMRDQINAWEDT